MTGKTHVAIGLALGLTLSFKQPFENQLAIVAASTIGALIPDLDHPKGELNQKLLLYNNNFFKTLFYLGLGLIFLYLYSQKNNILFIFIGFFSISLGFAKHRGFTHSLIGLASFIGIVALSSYSYGLSIIYKGFVLGYISHLILDLLTPKGIRLFFPLKINTSLPLTVKNNSFAEKLIFSLFSIYSILIIFINFIR